MKVIITTKGASESNALVDALKNPMNLYDVQQSADNTVEIAINKNHEAALELLSRLVLAQPQYIAIGTESVLAEQLKQTAQILAGRGAQIDAAVEEAVSGFSGAKRWRWPSDPIILDLDGDGLETVGLASSTIHFDHDGDGVLTQTGWAGKDDALLVWDRNADGLIDTGAELFGDFTVLPNGTLAPNGFAALAALDSNGDGILDASDPAFAELKLWRDASQDGVSQGGEFITLAEAGIVSLNLAHTLKNQRLANGNVLSREGSFARVDGSTSGMGEFKLAIDTFDTRFAEAIDIPEPLQTLPTMSGAGNVRELQQAAAQNGDVATLLGQFQTATTRTAQRALLDLLLTAWAGTAGMDSLEERAGSKYRILYEAFGNVRRSDNFVTRFVQADVGSASDSGFSSDLLGNALLNERYRALIAEWQRKLGVLEAFNGQYFFNLPQEKRQADSANWGLSVGIGSGGGGVLQEKSRRWWDGDECANGMWRMAA